MADHNRMTHLNARGDVINTFGPPPPGVSPVGTRRIAIGPGPYIYLFDWRYRLFVFSIDGHPLAWTPTPVYQESSQSRIGLNEVELSADLSGVVSIHPPRIENRNETLQYSSSGVMIGARSLTQSDPHNRASFIASPDGDGGWLRDFGKVTRVGTSGEPRYAIRHAANGNWLGTQLHLAISPGGNSAIVDHNGVSIYDANGEPRALIESSSMNSQVAIEDNLLVVLNWRSDEDSDIAGYDLEGRKLWQALFPPTHYRPDLYLPAQFDGELWVRNEGMWLDRYALP